MTAIAGPDSSADISTSFDIAAPPKVVWSTLTDCANAARFMPKLISCKILQKGPGDRWAIREHRLNGGLLTSEMRNVFRAELSPPNRFTFHRVSGDWRISQGSWTLTPIDGGKGTHVAYHTEVAVNGPVPAGMARRAIAKGAPEAMIALRREAVSRAGRAAD